MSTGVTSGCGLDFCDSANSLNSAVAGDNLQNSVASLEGPNLSLPLSYFNSTKLIKSGHGEDLYTWMAKQELDDTTTKATESKVAKSTFWVRHDVSIFNFHCFTPKNFLIFCEFKSFQFSKNISGATEGGNPCC